MTEALNQTILTNNEKNFYESFSKRDALTNSESFFNQTKMKVIDNYMTQIG